MTKTLKNLPPSNSTMAYQATAPSPLVMYISRGKTFNQSFFTRAVLTVMQGADSQLERQAHLSLRAYTARPEAKSQSIQLRTEIPLQAASSVGRSTIMTAQMYLRKIPGW